MPLIDDFGTLVDETGKAIPASKGMLNRAGSAIISKLPSSSAAIKGLGKLAIYGAPVAGAFQTMGASPEQITGYAEGLGANPATRGGRILGNTAMFVDETLMGAPSRIAAAGREAIADPTISRAERYDPAHALSRFGRNLFGRLGQDVADWWNEPVTGPGIPAGAPGVTASGFSNVPIDAGDFARGEPAAAARTGGGLSVRARAGEPAPAGVEVIRGTVRYGADGKPVNPNDPGLDWIRNQEATAAAMSLFNRMSSEAQRVYEATKRDHFTPRGIYLGSSPGLNVLSASGNAVGQLAGAPAALEQEKIRGASALERAQLEQVGATSRHDFAGAQVKQLEANAIMEMLNPGTNPERRALLRNTFGFGGKQADTTKVGEAQKAVQTLLANAKSAAEYARILEAQLDAQKLGKSGADLVDFINRALISPQTGVKP